MKKLTSSMVLVLCTGAAAALTTGCSSEGPQEGEEAGTIREAEFIPFIGSAHKTDGEPGSGGAPPTTSAGSGDPPDPPSPTGGDGTGSGGAPPAPAPIAEPPADPQMDVGEMPNGDPIDIATDTATILQPCDPDTGAGCTDLAFEADTNGDGITDTVETVYNLSLADKHLQDAMAAVVDGDEDARVAAVLSVTGSYYLPVIAYNQLVNPNSQDGTVNGGVNACPGQASFNVDGVFGKNPLIYNVNPANGIVYRVVKYGTKLYSTYQKIFALVPDYSRNTYVAKAGVATRRPSQFTATKTTSTFWVLPAEDVRAVYYNTNPETMFWSAAERLQAYQFMANVCMYQTCSAANADAAACYGGDGGSEPGAP